MFARRARLVDVPRPGIELRFRKNLSRESRYALKMCLSWLFRIDLSDVKISTRRSAAITTPFSAAAENRGGSMMSAAAGNRGGSMMSAAAGNRGGSMMSAAAGNRGGSMMSAAA
jgi:hypothetical protein